MGLFDRQKIDEDVWEELEELLISADVGVATANKLIEKTRQRATEEKLEGSQVSAALREEIVNILSLPPRPESEKIPPPKVILLVGVGFIYKTLKDVDKPTQVLNIISVILLVYPVFTLVSFTIRTQSGLSQADEIQFDSQPLTPSNDNSLPDIYYIVLDT